MLPYVHGRSTSMIYQCPSVVWWPPVLAKNSPALLPIRCTAIFCCYLCFPFVVCRCQRVSSSAGLASAIKFWWFPSLVSWAWPPWLHWSAQFPYGVPPRPPICYSVAGDDQCGTRDLAGRIPGCCIFGWSEWGGWWGLVSVRPTICKVRGRCFGTF